MIFNANPEDYAKELELMGGMSKKLLWANASPTSTFSTQTINVDLSEYDELEIEYKSSTGSAYSNIIKTNVGRGGFMFSFAGQNESGNLTLNYRSFTSSKTNVEFNVAYSKNVTGATQTTATYIIPVAIYGVKGVQ